MEKTAEMPLGVVVTKTRGKSRWAKWIWRASAVLPGAGPAAWKELRRDDASVEYHATTQPLVLHRAETEAYLTGLAMETPSVWIIMRPSDDPDDEEDVFVHSVTASPYEAQDYADSGEEIVEAVPMPEGLVAWVRDFVERHHVEEEFKKRRRDRVNIDKVQDGVGDARVRQDFDVYRAPQALKPKGRVH
ncbi:MAG: DUF3305 domain-containing protein [Pseudomonadota bacterium]